MNNIYSSSDISVNVYKFDVRQKTYIYPFYRSMYSFQKQINLLLLEEGEKWHYVYIKSLETLMKQRTNRTRKLFVCPRCYKQTEHKSVYEKHMLICNTENKQIEEMPEDTTMKFRNHKYRQRNAITLYAGKINEKCFM